jgi:hypothetical protein
MELNRLKVVLVERQKIGKWLAETLGKNETTVFRWCSKVSQLLIETLFVIANTLKVDCESC